MIQDNGYRKAALISHRDGDTVKARIIALVDSSEEIAFTKNLRLTIIDTPEIHDVGGAEAALFTAQFIGQEVQVKLYKATFDRIMADVLVMYEGEQRNLSELLLSKGLATVYGK
jgi:endonuclease YncB( thermonuclease family)